MNVPSLETEEALRVRAEKRAVLINSKKGNLTSPADAQMIPHELQVHQIEIEMQNDELRRIQAELEISRERYFELYDRAPVGYCTLDNKNMVLECNSTLCTLLNVPKEALTGHLFNRYIHAGDRECFYLLRRKVLAGTATHQCELRLMSGSNNQFWAQLEAIASVNKKGAPVYRIAISDITDRKKIESKLVETSRELERVVMQQKQVILDTREHLEHETTERVFAETELSHRQTALEAVYAIETAVDFTMESLYDQVVSSIATTLRIPLVTISECREGKIIRSSHCIDGVVAHSAAGAKPCPACAPEQGTARSQQYSGNLERQFEGELCFDHSRFKSYASVPVKAVDGRVLGMITVLDDRPRQFQNHEIQFIEIFGRYISHELVRRDLESRLHRSEEIHSLGQLTAGVAHEVRNPLNGILAIMDALDKELGYEERFWPYMRHMSSQVSRLSLLMEDLLALGKPVRKENMKKVSMVTIFETALAAWLPTLIPLKPVVRFTIPHDPQSCIIRADSTAMAQMIINLLENAHNHSPADSEILCSIVDHYNGMMTFTVTDQGSGISDEHLPKIFDPFFTTRKGGTGLGLSIIRTIVENHHGSVSAGNNPGGSGATFTVVIPLYCEMSEPQPAFVRALPVPSGLLNSRNRRSTDITG